MYYTYKSKKAIILFVANTPPVISLKLIFGYYGRVLCGDPREEIMLGIYQENFTEVLECIDILFGNLFLLQVILFFVPNLV